MNIALLTAGGIGSRMSLSLPKQFMTVQDKPVIIWTAEAFERHPLIDEIHIVCLKGWENYISAIAHDYGITKLKSIISGGNTNFESIRNGVLMLKEVHELEDDDIVIIHDGNRPLVTERIISDCLYTTQSEGSGVAFIPTTEVVYQNENDSLTVLDREHLLRTQTPHGFRLGDALAYVKRAHMMGLHNASALCELMVRFGDKPGLYNGSVLNFKITTIEDLEIFKALIKEGRK